MLSCSFCPMLFIRGAIPRSSPHGLFSTRASSSGRVLLLLQQRVCGERKFKGGRKGEASAPDCFPSCISSSTLYSFPPSLSSSSSTSSTSFLSCASSRHALGEAEGADKGAVTENLSVLRGGKVRREEEREVETSLGESRLASPFTPQCVIMAKVLDLKSNYVFYGAYHADSVNKAIHIVCVWPILFASMLLLLLLPPLSPWPALPFPWGGSLSLSLPFLVSLFYMSFYLLLEPKAGAVAAALVASSFLGSHFLFHTLGAALSWKLGLGLEVFCWSAQFIGHGAFEGRAPALLDNLAQAFLMAPFFVLLEVLHGVFKFEPEAGFWKTVEGEIAKRRAEFKSQKTKAL